MACSLWNTNRWCGVWVSQWRSKAGSGWMSCDSSISLFTLSWNYFRWPPVPWGMYKENKITFLTYINRAITQQNIPPESLLNADQTSRSYVSMGKMTMASWLTDKRNIILTSTISLLGHFLPMQFIYQGKATASQPASQVVLNQFAISQNPRQQSNEAEMLMLIDNYSDQKKKGAKTAINAKSLACQGCIWWPKKLTTRFCPSWHHWRCVRSSKQLTFPPASQPYCQWRGKHFMKGQFMKWYSAEIQQ